MNDHLVTNEIFSVATLMYARLRRVTGRVIDVIYFTENMDYAKHIIEIASETGDLELLRLVDKYKSVTPFKEFELENILVEESLSLVEPTEDDVYRAQVSHHYIGALR